MTKATRGRYTLEFKQEAVRLVESGQTMAAVSRSLGVVEQTLYNCVKAHRAGTLKGASGKSNLPSDEEPVKREITKEMVDELRAEHPTWDTLKIAAELKCRLSDVNKYW